MVQAHQLQRLKFRKIRLSNPTNPSAETSTPLITVPDFSDRWPWQISTSAALHFLLHLPLLPLTALPADASSCNSCYTRYDDVEYGDKPVRLSCQHIYGRRCLGEWFLSANLPPKNTCPICRSKLFDKEIFESPHTSSSPRVDGEMEEWVRETEHVCQGDPYAEERVEMLVQDLARVGLEVPSGRMLVDRSMANIIRIAQQGRERYGDLVAAREEWRLQNAALGD